MTTVEAALRELVDRNLTYSMGYCSITREEVEAARAALAEHAQHDCALKRGSPICRECDLQAIEHAQPKWEEAARDCKEFCKAFSIPRPGAMPAPELTDAQIDKLLALFWKTRRDSEGFYPGSIVRGDRLAIRAIIAAHKATQQEKA